MDYPKQAKGFSFAVVGTALFLIACMGVSAIPSISTLTPIVATETKPPLVGREPRLWVPPFQDFSEYAFADLSKFGAYSKTNRDIANISNDPEVVLANLNRLGVIVSFSYIWDEESCLEIDYQGMGRASINFILHKTSEDAHNDYVDFYEVNNNNPQNTVQEVAVADEAFITMGWDDSCDTNRNYAYIMLRRYNVVASFSIDSYSPNTAIVVTKEFQERWGGTLDNMILAEAQTHPGDVEMLRALENSIQTYIVEDGVSDTGTGIDSGFGSDADTDNDGVITYDECILKAFNPADCDGLPGYIYPFPSETQNP